MVGRLAVDPTRRQALDAGIPVGHMEERKRLPRRRVGKSNPVHGRPPAVVGPLRYGVAQVHNEGVGTGCDVVPSAVWLLDLQTAHVVGAKNRERAVVAVGSGTK